MKIFSQNLSRTTDSLLKERIIIRALEKTEVSSKSFIFKKVPEILTIFEFGSLAKGLFFVSQSAKVCLLCHTLELRMIT